MFRFCFRLIELAFIILASSTSLIHAQDTNTAPLALFINGGGTVSPLTNGQVLVVGQSYNMVATADNGYSFSSWQQVNVFTTTSYVVDTNGNAIPVVSTILRPLPPYTNQPSLDFVMQPVTTIYNNPGFRTITESSGWQANFEPILLSIQLSDSAAILTWTNSSYSLQAAPSPLGVYSNISAAVSPYTNNLSGSAKYFRLAK